jgi:hypothetical protein
MMGGVSMMTTEPLLIVSDQDVSNMIEGGRYVPVVLKPHFRSRMPPQITRPVCFAGGPYRKSRKNLAAQTVFC